MELIKTELRAESLAVEETLFHVANGYLGVRGSLEEGCPEGVLSIRGCYINGFYDTVELHYPEKFHGFPEQAQRMIRLPDVQTVRLWLDGEEFSPFHGELLDYRRALNTEEGVTRRQMHWRGRGGAVIVTVTRMASFARPELFLTLYEVESAGFEGEIKLVSGVDCAVFNHVDPSDPRLASDRRQNIFFEGAEVCGDYALARCRTGASGLALAVCQRHRLSAEGNADSRLTDTGFEIRLTARMRKGERLVLEKYTLLSDSRRQPDPAGYALAAAAECVSVGAAALLEEQRKFLSEFWSVARADISGCPEIREGMEFNLYQLLQSAGRDAVGSVAAKGLSGEGYEGHYFWDAEIYVLPFFLFTRPDIARLLLDFRYAGLESARRHARLLGHQSGALYPWRTITGSECSSYYPSGSAQYHITGDVAHSFLQYYRATGDLDYMAEKGAEVLLETARFWLGTGHYDRAGRFCIQTVTGPDEYTCLVNNNYYTNRCAQYNLRASVEVYEALERAGLHRAVQEKTGIDWEELDDFLRAADAMYLPYAEELDIHMQDDSFLDKPLWDIAATPKENFPLLLHYHPLFLYRHQVCKQADTVLAHFLFEEGVQESTMLHSYEYYERITTHDSSLSSCVFSIMASRLGFAGKAYRYFLDTVRADLDNVHGNTRDGLHIANLGGTWLALACGFAGLRLRADGLHFRFTLPAEWDGYSFCVRYRNSLLRLRVRRDAAEIILEQGEAVTVFVGDRQYSIHGTVAVEGVVG